MVPRLPRPTEAGATVNHGCRCETSLSMFKVKLLPQNAHAITIGKSTALRKGKNALRFTMETVRERTTACYALRRYCTKPRQSCLRWNEIFRVSRNYQSQSQWDAKH